MNFCFRSLSLTAVGLSVLALSTGCETSKCKTEDGREAVCAKSLTTFVGDPVSMSADYTENMDLSIYGVKGAIVLVPGGAGVVNVTFKPFTVRAHDANADAQEDLTVGWTKDVRAEGNAIVVETHQAGESDEVGAVMEIEVPPEFNGAITIENRSAGNADDGRISIEEGGAALAWSVDMKSQGLGDCNLDGFNPNADGPTITSTTVNCEGIVEVTDVSDFVNVYGDGTILDGEPFGVRVRLASIADDGGGTIESANGNVELNLPPAGNYQITAAPNANGGMFQYNTPPDGCEVTDNVLSCGTGSASFIASAGTQDSFDPGHVNVSFNP